MCNDIINILENVNFYDFFFRIDGLILVIVGGFVLVVVFFILIVVFIICCGCFRWFFFVVVSRWFIDFMIVVVIKVIKWKRFRLFILIKSLYIKILFIISVYCMLFRLKLIIK